MPTPAIIRGSDHFFVNTYEGNGTGQRVGKFLPFTNNGTIAKSCIFDDGSTPALSRTLSGDGNKKKFTISVWVKRCVLAGDYAAVVVGGGTSGSSAGIFFNSSQQLYIYFFGAEALKTNRTFKDTSKWYHIVVRVDSSDSTADDRVRLYVDGDQITSFATRNNPSQEAEETLFNVNAKNIDLGRHTTSTYYYDGYLAEVNFADGQSYGPDTFGITDTSTGRWIPKSLTGITYGTNGFRMEFANSAGQTIGDDTSGQGNDKSVVNIATTDLTTDSPTQNFMTFDASRIYSTAQTLSEGNLKLTGSSGSGYPKIGANKEIPQTGKWYWEVLCTTAGGYQGIANPSFGVIDLNIVDGVEVLSNANFQNTKGGMGSMQESGFKFTGLLSTSQSISTIGSTDMASGDYMLFAFDMDDGKAWWGFRDTSGSSTVWYANDGGTDGNPGAGTNPTVTFNPKDHRFLIVNEWYAPGSYPGVFTYNFGQKAFSFTAPTGFGKLSQENFENLGDKDIPDLVWIKSRDTASAHMLFDSSRGPELRIKSDSTSSETTSQGTVFKFLKGGYAVGEQTSVNKTGDSTVGWCWHANGGTTSANTDGSGATIASTIQANQTAGFSIVQWTGNNTSNSKIAHGLSQAPEWILVKNLTDNTDWWVYHKNLTADKNLKLNETAAEGTFSTGVFDHSGITSTVFEVDNGSSSGNSINGNTDSMLAYCWHGVEGYSKFGSYTGNGSSNGTFINLGFKPAVIITKNISGSYRWNIIDNKRDPFNPAGRWLAPDNTDDEDAYTGSYPHDFLSNGFKLRANTTVLNKDNNTFVYAAFAEHPFIGDGTNPCTAR